MDSMQAQGQPKPRDSLSENAVRVFGRLAEMKGRVIHIHDTIFGSEPRSAELSGVGRGNDAQVPNVVQYHINNSHQMLNEIEAMLSRIESKL